MFVWERFSIKQLICFGFSIVCLLLVFVVLRGHNVLFIRVVNYVGNLMIVYVGVFVMNERERKEKLSQIFVVHSHPKRIISLNCQFLSN